MSDFSKNSWDSKDNKNHGEIKAEGMLARMEFYPAKANPYSKIACEKKNLAYDPEAEQSWLDGWLETEKKQAYKP